VNILASGWNCRRGSRSYTFRNTHTERHHLVTVVFPELRTRPQGEHYKP